MSVNEDIFKNNARKKKIEALLKLGITYIYVNTKRSGVILPPDLMAQPTTTLQISYNFQGALTLHKDHVEAILTFGNNTERCVAPYSSIWAIGNQGTLIMETWTEALPEEVLQMMFENKSKGSKDDLSFQTSVTETSSVTKPNKTEDLAIKDKNLKSTAKKSHLKIVKEENKVNQDDNKKKAKKTTAKAKESKTKKSLTQKPQITRVK